MRIFLNYRSIYDNILCNLKVYNNRCTGACSTLNMAEFKSYRMGIIITMSDLPYKNLSYLLTRNAFKIHGYTINLLVRRLFE